MKGRKASAAVRRPEQIPDFKTEAEEARWWEKQSSRIAQRMEEAIAAGEDLMVVPAPLERALAAKNVTIRLSLADLERARKQAERRGLRYQTYVKMLLHQALVADARRLA
jgi:predicted DNA binding CopG/RHH family protein